MRMMKWIFKRKKIRKTKNLIIGRNLMLRMQEIKTMKEKKIQLFGLEDQ